MLRPSRIKYVFDRSIYAIDNLYMRRRIPNAFTYIILGMFIPYLSVKTFNLLERLEFWERRLNRRRIEKMSYDWMIKSLAERERDVIEEFSDY